MNKDFTKLFKKFIHDVLDPLVETYEVQKQRIRLLWDDSCDDLAAFTLNTIIYLNVGYFAVTHHGKMAHHDQLIVWYHLLAHEMAVSVYIYWGVGLIGKLLVVPFSTDFIQITMPTLSYSVRESVKNTLSNCSPFLR